MAMMHRDEGCNPLFGGFFPMAMYCADGAILSSAVFAMAMHRDEGVHSAGMRSL